MRILFLLALLFSCAGARANEVDEINRDVEGLQQNMNQVRRVLQERMGGAGIDPARVEQARRKILSLSSDQKFIKALGSLWNHPARNTLLVAQLVCAVLVYFFKAWRQAKARNWFTRLLAGLFWALFSWIVILLVLPYLILGESFRTVITTLWRVFWA